MLAELMMVVNVTISTNFHQIVKLIQNSSTLFSFNTFKFSTLLKKPGLLTYLAKGTNLTNFCQIAKLMKKSAKHQNLTILANFGITMNFANFVKL